MADHVYKTTSINPFTRSVDGVLDENKHQNHTTQNKSYSRVLLEQLLYVEIWKYKDNGFLKF